MENGYPPIMFRPPSYIIEILKAEAEQKGMSVNLLSKAFLIDHMFNLKLIPVKLLPHLIKNVTVDYFTDLQKSYNLTDAEMQDMLKLIENLKNAYKKNN